MAATIALIAAPAVAAAHDPGVGHHKPAVVDDGKTWHLRQDHSTGVADHTFNYGSWNDSTHVMGDWDGDGERTPGVIRFQGDRDNDGRTDMVWYLRNGNTSGHADIVASFGEVHHIERHDIPVVGDWNGDGTETIGVARHDFDRGEFLWLLRNSNSSGNADVSFHYGPTGPAGIDPDEPTGVPVVGDWDGDGTDTVGVHRYPNEWFLTNRHNTGRADIHYTYGTRNMKPLIWR